MFISFVFCSKLILLVQFKYKTSINVTIHVILMLIQVILCYCLQAWFVCLFVCFWVRWSMPRTVIQLLVCWKGQFGKQDGTEIWKGAFLYTRGRELSMEECKPLLLMRLHQLIKAINSLSPMELSGISRILDVDFLFVLCFGSYS